MFSYLKQKLPWVAMGIGISLTSMAFTREDFCQKEKPYEKSSLRSSLSAKDAPHLLELRHTEGKGIGYKEGYTTTEFFFSQSKDVHLMYLDERVHLINNGRWAFNTGLGYRYYYDRKDQIYGFNLFFDFRDTRHAEFTQVGLGFETLGNRVNFRSNFYFPVMKTRKTLNYEFDEFQGYHAYIKRNFQQSMGGVDSEIETRCLTHDKMVLDVGLGGYYFQGMVKKFALGAKARFKAEFYDCLYAQASTTYDNLFHFHAQGEVGLHFSLDNPFSSKESKKNRSCSKFICSCKDMQLSKRMKKLPLRNDMIVVSKAHTSQMAKDPNGVPYFFYHVNNLSPSGDGTAENPFPSLPEAEAASSDSEILYVHFGDGTAFNLNSGVTLNTNQRLLGSGVSHPLSTTNGMVEIPALTPNQNPKLTNNDLLVIGPAVSLADGSEVSGFDIVGARGAGIQGLHLTQGVKISKNRFFDNGDGGNKASIYISFDNNVLMGKTVEISDNLITSQLAGVVGVWIEAPQQGLCGLNVDISDNRIGSNSLYGIYIHRTGVLTGEFRLTGAINNNKITAQESTALFFSHDPDDGIVNLDLDVNNNIITANVVGMDFTRARGSLRIKDNEVYSNRNIGMRIAVGPSALQPENLILDLIGNNLFSSSIANNNLLVTLTNGTVDCRFIDMSSFDSGPIKMYLDNNAAVGNFRAQIRDVTGPLQLDNITLVP